MEWCANTVTLPFFVAKVKMNISFCFIGNTRAELVIMWLKYSLIAFV